MKYLFRWVEGQGHTYSAVGRQLSFVYPSTDSRIEVVKLLAKVYARSIGQPLRRSKPTQEKCG